MLCTQFFPALSSHALVIHIDIFEHWPQSVNILVSHLPPRSSGGPECLGCSGTSHQGRENRKGSQRWILNNAVYGRPYEADISSKPYHATQNDHALREIIQLALKWQDQKHNAKDGLNQSLLLLVVVVICDLHDVFHRINGLLNNKDSRGDGLDHIVQNTSPCFRVDLELRQGNRRIETPNAKQSLGDDILWMG